VFEKEGQVKLCNAVDTETFSPPPQPRSIRISLLAVFCQLYEYVRHFNCLGYTLFDTHNVLESGSDSITGLRGVEGEDVPQLTLFDETSLNHWIRFWKCCIYQIYPRQCEPG
jgi:hypothetical protein